MILLADSEDPDQTARMRRLIWVFALRICLKTGFRMVRPILNAIDLALIKSEVVNLNKMNFNQFTVQTLSLRTNRLEQTM